MDLGSKKSVKIAPLSGDGKAIFKKSIKVKVNLLALSEGWTPSVHLFSQSGGKLIWDSNLFCFKLLFISKRNNCWRR